MSTKLFHSIYSLQNLMLDLKKKKKSQIGQEFSSENDFEPRFSISLHCATVQVVF